MLDKEEVKEATDAVEKKVEKIDQAEWQKREQLKAELRAEIRPEYEALLQFWKNNELDSVKKEYDKVAEEGVKKLFDKWKEEQKPLSVEQIQELLNQEYVTFTLRLSYPVVNNSNEVEEKTETFTIRELPSAAEEKFYKQIKTKVLNKTSAIQALAQSELDQPFETKLKSILEIVDESFDVLSDTVSLILNPFGKRNDITQEWVRNHISSNRQWQIVEAQIHVNRLKDFFSKLSLSGQTTQTTLAGRSFQQLQQLVR